MSMNFCTPGQGKSDDAPARTFTVDVTPEDIHGYIEHLKTKIKDYDHLKSGLETAIKERDKYKARVGHHEATVKRLIDLAYGKVTYLDDIYSLRDECAKIIAYISTTSADQLRLDLNTASFGYEFLGRPLPEQVFFFKKLVACPDREKTSVMLRSRLYMDWCCNVPKATGLNQLNGIQFHAWWAEQGLGALL